MSKNIEGLKEYWHSESKKKEEIVLDKLNEMIKSGTPISISSLAKMAEVSRKYIYSKSHLVEKINNHRGKSHSEFLFQKSGEILNSNQYKSLKAKYETVLLRNSSLREQVDQLKSENDILREYIEQLESKADKISLLRNS